jgi:hypothetical protein
MAKEPQASSAWAFAVGLSILTLREFFLAIGDPIASRTGPPPQLSEAERAERKTKADALAPQYRTEMLHS